MVTSLLKTLAGKYDSTVTKMARKYAATIETPHGPRKCMQVSRRPWRGQEAAGRHVRWYSAQAAEERDPAGPRSSPSDLPPQRAGPPAPGGTVRALRASGRRCACTRSASSPISTSPDSRQPEWVQIMARRRRKTLVVCEPCYASIHPREANRVNHGIVAGEPGELKGSRRVREGGVGKGRHTAPRRQPTSAAGSRKATGNRDMMAGPSSRPSRITGLCVSVLAEGR